MQFMSPTKGRMTIDEVAADIRAYQMELPDSRYRLIVGADSQPQSARFATVFVSAIVIHRVGKGARFYFLKRPYKKPLAFRQRIFTEAAMALEVVQALEASLEKVGSNLPVEIHLDIGEEGQTRELIKEIVGWITQSGYDAKIKPDSFGASKVADRFTKS
jgi:predicted RNase H-related nuclease YkuK (DUF458 family)